MANRWFVARRGLVLGFFGAAGSAGQLLFVPLLMALVVAVGWRASQLVLAGIVALILIPVFLLMRDDPADLGLRPYGAPPPPPGSVAPAPVAALTAGAGIMARAVRVPEFWLLSGSFFVCGATSNGLIGDAPHPPLRRPRHLGGDRGRGPGPDGLDELRRDRRPPAG